MRFGCLVFILIALGGCAESRLQDDSRLKVASGLPDQAVIELQDGLKRYPENISLQSELLTARLRAQELAVGDAETLIAAGAFDSADARVRQTLVIEPDNAQLKKELTKIDTARRQQAVLSEAQDLASRGLREQALTRISLSLEDNPYNASLNDFKLKLQTEQRQEQLQNAQSVLDEKRPISLDFRDANLRSVLDVVSRSSGINFIFDRDLRADTRITVYLRGARVEDALDLITSTNQLAMKVVDSRTVLIYPNTAEKQREYQEQVVRVFYLANADAKGAASFLRAILKTHDPFVDERMNMIALRDNHENIRLAERLIAMYDSADPEVVLEMDVLEISSTTLTNLGVQLPTSFSLTPIAPGTASSSTGSSSSGLTLGNIRSLTKDNIALGLGAVTVNLQRQVGDFSTLANPQVRVKNKEKAKILVGDKIPIVTSTTGTGGFVSDSVSYQDVGLKLEVQPTIYPDDDVSINVGLEVSTLGSSITTSSGTLAYQIGTREASTVLRLHDGQTQVLAGLISKNESSNSNRIPGLGDLPIVGRLFSSTLDNGDKTELVLAITPHIVRNLHQPTATESEVWVGTENAPKLRSYGGLQVIAEGSTGPAAATPAARVDGVAPAVQPVIGASAAMKPSTEAAVLNFQGPHEVHVGDTFEMQLAASSVEPLRGLPVQIHFDPKRLQFSDASAGDFFRQGGAEVSLSKGADSTGTARIGVIRNQATGASGNGVAMTVRFKVLSAGDTSIGLESAQALGLQRTLPTPTLPSAWAVHVQ